MLQMFFMKKLSVITFITLFFIFVLVVDTYV